MTESPLYHHPDLNAFECLGCGEFIEVPRLAIIGDGHKRRVARIAGQPENLLLWLEMHELDHAKCHLFGDAEKALQARAHRKEGARRELTGEKIRARCGAASARREGRTASSEPPLAEPLRG